MRVMSINENVFEKCRINCLLQLSCEKCVFIYTGQTYYRYPDQLSENILFSDTCSVVNLDSHFSVNVGDLTAHSYQHIL